MPLQEIALTLSMTLSVGMVVSNGYTYAMRSQQLMQLLWMPSSMVSAVVWGAPDLAMYT